MVDREILVSGFGIFGFAPMAKPHLSFVDPPVALDWRTQVEIQVYQDFYIST